MNVYMSNDEIKIKVHMFWAYGNLSKLECLSIRSYLYHNYNLILWTYGEIKNIPEGVEVRDAREILPESRVFLNNAGSYASFSDLFRYSILNKFGGMWSDTDVIANTDASKITSPFLVTERIKGSKDIKINNNIIYNPNPAKGNLIDLAEAVADRFPINKITWSELGPDLLTSLVILQREHGFQIKPPIFGNPIDYWDCPYLLLSDDISHIAGSEFVHCYNEMWKRHGVDKNLPYPPGSIMGKFERKYIL